MSTASDSSLPMMWHSKDKNYTAQVMFWKNPDVVSIITRKPIGGEYRLDEGPSADDPWPTVMHQLRELEPQGLEFAQLFPDGTFSIVKKKVLSSWDALLPSLKSIIVDHFFEEELPLELSPFLAGMVTART